MMNFKKILNYLKQYLFLVKEYKYRLLLLLLLLIINMVLATFGLTLMMPIINTITNEGQNNISIIRYIYKLFTVLHLQPTLFNLLSFFMLIIIIKNIVGYVETIVRAKLQRDIVYNIGNKIFNNLMDVSYSYYHNTKKGDIYYYINGAACYIMFSLVYLINLIFNFFLVIGYTFILLSISIKITVIITAVTVISVVIFKTIIKKSRRIAKKQAELNQKFNSAFVETIDGIKVVKAYLKEDYEKKKFQYNWYEFLNSIYKGTKNSAIITSFKNPISFGIIVGFFYIVVNYYKFKFSTISVYFLILYKLVPLFQEFTDIINALTTTLPPVEIAMKAISKEDKPYLISGTREIKCFDNLIEFKNLSFKYIKENVLTDINCKFKKNETTAIIGATGSGKSTIVDLILRLYDPTEGAIFVDSENLKNLNISQWRNLIAIVFQDTFLFNDSIKNNILYGRLDATFDDVIESAKIANAYNFIMNLPQQFDTLIGERGVKLSGGQKQMIALARAIIRKPEILILDEATSSLDNASERAVQKAIENLKGKMTIIVIAHRMSTILNADKIIVMDKGQIVETGSHNDLIDNSIFYSKYYKLQFRNEAVK